MIEPSKYHEHEGHTLYGNWTDTGSYRSVVKDGEMSAEIDFDNVCEVDIDGCETCEEKERNG